MSANNHDDERVRDEPTAPTASDRPDFTPREVPDPSTLEDRIETLEAENERLRETVAAATRSQYRRTAIGFAAIGLLALVGAYLFAPIRSVLVALGGTGLFGAILVYFLTPERFVAASVGERIYAPLARNESAIIDDLSLRGNPVFVRATGSAAPARLFVPLTPDTSPPSPIEGTAPFQTDEPAGLVLEPTGAPLYTELIGSGRSGAIPDSPTGIARVVGDALVEQFELVDAVEVDGDDGRVTMAIDGSAYGALDQFDHPAVSVVGTALAVESGTHVTPTVASGTRAEWLVTYRFVE